MFPYAGLTVKGKQPASPAAAPKRIKMVGAPKGLGPLNYIDPSKIKGGPVPIRKGAPAGAARPQGPPRPATASRRAPASARGPLAPRRGAPNASKVGWSLVY